MKPLSQHLTELSIQVRKAEERVAKAQSDVKERLEEKREQVHRETEQALESVRQRVSQSREETRTRFDAMHAKLNSDFDRLRQHVTEKKQRFQSWQANNNADDKELDALAAIDYAIAATKIAELQTIEAIAARMDALDKDNNIQVSQPITT